MDRRSFLALTGQLFAAPFAAEAQQAATPYRIGILALAPPREGAAPSAFRNRLVDLGYVEGRTVQFESRYAEGRPERLPALAADLVRLNVDVLVTVGTQATKAAKQATATIPIVFIGVARPIEAGVVASLARPGGNVTGATDQLGDLGGKLLQLVTETVPNHARIALLTDFALAGSGRQDFDQAAQRLGLTLVRVNVRSPEDVDTALTKC